MKRTNSIIKFCLKNHYEFVFLTIIFLFVAHISTSLADTASQYPIVHFDANSKTFDSYLPFDQPFLIQGSGIKGLKKVKVQYKIKNSSKWEETDSVWTINPQLAMKDTIYSIGCPKLSPNKSYAFKFTFTVSRSSDEINEIKNNSINIINIDYPINGISVEIKKDISNTDSAKDSTNEIASIQSNITSNYQEITRKNLINNILTITDNKSVTIGEIEIIAPGNNNKRKGKIEDDLIIEDRRHQEIQKINEEIDSISSKINESTKLINKWDIITSDTINKRIAKTIYSNIMDIGESDKSIIKYEEYAKLCFYLVIMDSELQKRIVTGLLPLSTNPENYFESETYLKKKNIKKVSELDAIISNYETTYISLLKIREIIKFAASHDKLIKNKKDRNQCDTFASSIDTLKNTLYDRITELKVARKKFIEREKLLDKMATPNTLKTTSIPSMETVRNTEYMTRAKWYFSADVGVGFSPEMNKILPMFCMNFNIRPINKNIPIKGFNPFKGFKHFREFEPLKRFSGIVGVTLTSVEEEGKRKNFYSNSALVTGLGFRINDYFRVSYGLLWFEADDNPSPLIEDYKFQSTQYCSISLDWDLKTMFGKLSTTFFGD